jgi:hypothetical protein
MYFVRIVGWLAIAALIGGVFVGALRLLVQIMYGHSVGDSLKIAVWFFVLADLIIWVSTATASIFVLLKKIKKTGFTVDYISKLSVKERKVFEKQHGF